MAFVLASPTTPRENYKLSFVQNEPKEAELALDKYKVFNETLNDILDKNYSPKIDPFPISKGQLTDNETEDETDSETETSVSTSTSKESYIEILRDKIIEIKNKKYNNKCADCSSKYVSYVIINLYIFVCNKCCLHHQSLGHNVKSITLDKFTQNEVEILQKNGNNKNSNKKYLAKYKKSNDITSQRYALIKQKYCDKLWTKETYNKNKNKTVKNKKKTKNTKIQTVNNNSNNKNDMLMDWSAFDNVNWDAFDTKNTTNNGNNNNISLQQSQTKNIFDIPFDNKPIETQPIQAPQNIQNKQLKAPTSSNTNFNANSNSKSKIMNIFKIYSTYNQYNHYGNYTHNNYYTNGYYQQTHTPPPPTLTQQQQQMYNNGYHNPFYQQQPVGAQVNDVYGWRY